MADRVETEGAGREPEQFTVSRDFLESFLDTDECWFDHHGGCQCHGYLDLEPGEKCPQRELKELLGHV